MTPLELARRGVITQAIHQVAETEKIDPKELRANMADGTLVIPLNKKHTGIHLVGIGKGLSINVNTNIGTSGDQLQS